MDLDKTFRFHPPTDDQIKKHERLTAAFLEYAKRLTNDRPMDEDTELMMELAYEDIIRVVNESIHTDCDEYERTTDMINHAFTIAKDPNRAIVLLIQGALMFAKASVDFN